jgi:hypothetical protein
MSTFDLGTGISAINTILAEEANRIGADIYQHTLHTSPWLDLTKQTAFPDGMGYQLSTLVYDRAIATTATNGNTAGVNWSSMATLSTGGNQFNTSIVGGQALDDAADNVQGGRGTGNSDKRSFVQFGKQLKKYSLERAVIESPRISLEDLRFAAHRQDQLRAIMDIMTQVTRRSWENRYRDEYERVAANFVPCLASATPFLTTVDADADGAADDLFEGNDLAGMKITTSGAGATDVSPTANISNAIMDKIYYRQVRAGAGSNAYGRENGRPVFAVVISSEASYKLQTEAEFRDDVRYNNAKVSDLIAPLGVEKSFRGFYHLVDDLAPRFSINGSGVLVKVEPELVSSGVATPNPAYDSASYEALYVMHPEVCEALIPNPLSGSNGISFNPTQYRGQFKWTNILNEITNPDGTVGFFRGVLASATKPIKTEFGYVVLFKRDDADAAA